MKVVCPLICQFCSNKVAVTTKQRPSTKVYLLNCGDRRYDCVRLKAQNWCVTYRNYLFTRCKRTCGFCEGLSSTLTATTTTTTPTTTTTTPTTTTTTPTTTTTTPTTTTTTQKSSRPCIDRRLDCYTLGVTHQYCTRFPKLAKTICSLTCNFCPKINTRFTVIAPTALVTPRYRTKTTSTYISCLDDSDDCYRLSRVFNWCQINRSRMKVICKRTCNLCEENGEKTTATTTSTTSTTTTPTTTSTTTTTTPTTTTTTPTTTTTTPTTTTTTTTTPTTTTTTTTTPTTTTTTTPTTTTTTTQSPQVVLGKVS